VRCICVGRNHLGFTIKVSRVRIIVNSYTVIDVMGHVDIMTGEPMLKSDVCL